MDNATPSVTAVFLFFTTESPLCVPVMSEIPTSLAICKNCSPQGSPTMDRQDYQLSNAVVAGATSRGQRSTHRPRDAVILYYRVQKANFCTRYTIFICFY